MAKIKQFKAFTNIFVALKKTGCMLKTLTLFNSVKECKMFPSSHHRRYYCEGNNNTWVSDSEVCNSVKDCPGGDDECQGCHNRYHKVLMCKVPLSKIPLFKVPPFKVPPFNVPLFKVQLFEVLLFKIPVLKVPLFKYQY